MSFLKSVTSQVEDTEVVSSLTFPQIVVSFKFCHNKWTDLTQDCIVGMLFYFYFLRHLTFFTQQNQSVVELLFE